MLKTLRLIVRLALAEIRGSLSFSLSFSVSLAIGLVGFLAIDALRGSLATNADERSKVLLAADLAVTSQLPLNAAVKSAALAALPESTLVREETSLYSMVASGAQSRLVELRAVDAQFPFYGTPVLRRGGAVTQAMVSSLLASKVVWVYPEVLAQLGVEIGAPLKIGTLTFTIADVVESDPSVGTVGLAMAPRVYLGMPFLKGTGLTAFGSRIANALLFKLPESGDAIKDLSLLDQRAAAVKRALPANELRVKTHREASADSQRLLSYLNDYLGLVALVALFLAGVGAMYLFRSFMARRSKDVAILLSVGAQPALAASIYVAQLMMLGAAAAVLALALTAMLLPALPLVLGSLAPEGLTASLRGQSVTIAIGAGVLGSLLFCQPTLVRLLTIKPQTLFQEDQAPQSAPLRFQALGWITLALVSWALSVQQAQSLRTGSLFVGLVFAASLVFVVFGYLATMVLERAKTWRRWRLRLAALNLARRRVATLASFLALSLGALLITVVPLIRAMIAGEFDASSGERPPSLFLFDIQQEQLEPLRALLQERQFVLDQASPMIRARLTHLNGKALHAAGDAERDADDSRNASTKKNESEQDREHLKARMYNLSYRATLTPSETLVAGDAFKSGQVAPPSGPAPVSLEVGFADRLGLRLGDTLSFDVQGVAIEGRVQNLRRVRWSSFQPNFFVQFLPGVLDDAPKQYVASIPHLTREQRIAVQAAIVAQFPNVTLIDVEQTVARLLAVAAQIGQAIAFMALMVLAAGVCVLYAIAAHKAQELCRDVALLKVLGAAFTDVRKVLLGEFALLGGLAASTGAIVGIGVSYVVSQQVFDRLWQLNLWIPLACAGLVTALCILTGWLAVRRSLATPALTLLQR